MALKKIRYFQLNYYGIGNKIPAQVYIKGTFCSFGEANEWSERFIAFTTVHQRKVNPKESKVPTIRIKPFDWKVPPNAPVFDIPHGKGVSMDAVLECAFVNVKQKQKTQGGSMALYYVLQFNIPAFEKPNPRLIRFYVKKVDMPKKNDVRDWLQCMQEAMSRHQKQARPRPKGKVACKILRTVKGRAKKAPPVLDGPHDKTVLDILALATHQEAS
jgi:hypothetical protein